MPATVRFWGVRGSIPAPLTSHELKPKVRGLIERFSKSVLPIEEFLSQEEFMRPYTYGGNTSCVEIRYGDHIWVCDLGTGARPFGISLFGEMMAKGGLAIDFLLSHVHWDHIQGLPFFAELFVNQRKTKIRNNWRFFGGTTWQKTAEACLRGQMDPPTFPVSFKEIEAISCGAISFCDVCDGFEIKEGMSAPVIEFGKLHHPQETYGARFVFPDGKIVTYATDWEPFIPEYPEPSLLHLARHADVLITDCQYSLHQYLGKEGGVPRLGWGHSFPEAVAAVVTAAEVKQVVLFHHDPASSDERIESLADTLRSLLSDGGNRCKVIPAWEGLTLTL